MSTPEVDATRFFTRLGKLHNYFVKHKDTIWNKANCLLLHRGKLNDDEPYQKSVILHQWLFGYELPDTIVLVRSDGHIWILATKKKCEFLKPISSMAIPESSTIKEIHMLMRNKEDGNAENYETLWKQASIPEEASEKEEYYVGMLVKERSKNIEGGGILGPWEQKLEKAKEDKLATFVDAAPGMATVMSVKDTAELDFMKKSSVLSNKVMKHGYVKKMEEVIDNEQKITHEELATYVEEVLEEPSKISLKVPADDVQSCYYPIVQSGGKYDIRVSAQSNDQSFSHDVITVSIGARYKMYCSNIARTFLVDPPKIVSETYENLLEMHAVCLKAMKPGKPLKAVYKAAVVFLQKNPKMEHLVEKLPKNLGFAMGLDFRESTLLLSPKNPIAFRKGMVFCLSVGFQNLELSTSDREASHAKSSVKKLSTYALLVSDMVSITSEGAEVMTKMGKAITDIAYNINEESGASGSEEDDSESDDDNAKKRSSSAPKGDDAYARKLAAKEETNGKGNNVRVSKRLAKDSGKLQEAHEGIAERQRRQIHLMTRRNEERLRQLARDNVNKRKDGSKKDQAEELSAYNRTKDYPDNVQPNQVKVDMVTQCVILPVCGNPVPFHISTIKNVVLPDPDITDTATLLRINFYTAGMAVGKDAPANMAKLVQKYAPYACFIREMTFRSLNGHNLTLAYRQISELRKRARTKEIQEQEEATLVEQDKLVRIKNERVHRLTDLSMRPVFGGRKTQGNLEAHVNGLRFISTRSEIVEVMYANIKYAIFQPCENDIMVLIHFHLKNPIMVGKKKHIDVQFFTEVIESSQTVDGNRSMYDPDEMDDEQRERHLRKRLNQAFKEFCKKVDMVHKKNGFSFDFDIPYRDLGFTGNPHREMVKVTPTLNCLVNLTETPFFVVDLDAVDHVHLERVTYMSKAFDMVLVNKDFAKQPWRIDMIPSSDKDSLQEWLTDMEITFTEGPMNLNWKQIMNTVKGDDRFYMNTEEDEVTEKEAGWEILRMYGREGEDEDDDDDEEDSEFDEGEGFDDGGSDESEESFDSEEDDESDFDADEDLEEQGLDWEDMEKEAAIDDKRKRLRGDEDPQFQKTNSRPQGAQRGVQRGAQRGAQRGGAQRGRNMMNRGPQRGGGSRPPSQQQRRRSTSSNPRDQKRRR